MGLNKPTAQQLMTKIVRLIGQEAEKWTLVVMLK